MDNFKNDELNAIAKEANSATDEGKADSFDDSFEENRETKKRKHESRSNDTSVKCQVLPKDFTDGKIKCENNFAPLSPTDNCIEHAKSKMDGTSFEVDEKCLDGSTLVDADILDVAVKSSVDLSVEQQLENIGRKMDADSSLESSKCKFKFKRLSNHVAEDSQDRSRLSSTPEDDGAAAREATAVHEDDDGDGDGENDGSESPELVRDHSESDAVLNDSIEDTPSDDTELTGHHVWFSQKAIRQREYGYSNAKSPDLFRYKAIGSLHMVQRLELMYKMENHDGCVNCLHFNASGTRLASGSDDLNVCIWDWAINKPLITFATGHRQNVFQAKFMPLSGDCHIVTCARDGQVRLAELSVQGVCKGTRKLAQHKGAAHKLALELDSPHVFLTCGEDGVVFELDLRDPKPNKLLVCKEPLDRDKTVPLYSIHSHPRNPYYFAVCGRDQYSRIYDKRYINDANSVKKFCPEHLVSADSSYKANITCLVFNHDGSELLASYNDDDIFLFDVNGNSEKADNVIQRYTGHRNNATVKGVNFYGPNSEFVISGSDCGYIYFWERKTERIVQFLQGDEQGVINVLEPHPTAAFLATSGLDHDIKIWVPSNEEPKFDKRSLKKLTARNGRDREADRRSENDMFDSHMLYLLLSRMRRSHRRRRSQSGEHGESNNDADDGSGEPTDDSGPGSDSDDDAEDPPALQCRTS